MTAAAGAMLTGPEPVTAVFAGNNRVTVTVVRVLAALPRPVALVGFDDFELADLLRPGVTVVAQDPAAMGRVATDRLFQRLAGTPSPGPHRTPHPPRPPRLGRTPAVHRMSPRSPCTAPPAAPSPASTASGTATPPR